MTIDQLKEEWTRTSLRVAELEKTNMELTDELRQTKLRPSLERLKSTYLRMAFISIIMIAVSPFFFYYGFAHIWVNRVTIPIFLWQALFLISFIGDTTLYFRIKKISLATMTVDEVAWRARSCRKFHLICQAVMIPIAIAFIWVLFLDASDASRFGMLIGGLIGLAFGIYKWLQIMRSYRTLMATE